MIDFYFLFLNLVFFGLMYFLFFPLAMRNFLLRKFDPELFNGKYWAEEEKLLPFYKYRRALMYSLAIASKWVARRKFQGFDFTSRVSSGVIFFCRLQAFFMVFSIVSLACGAFLKNR